MRLRRIDRSKGPSRLSRGDGVPFLAGAVAGLLLAAIWQQCSPGDDPDVARYREVRDYVRGSFVRDVSDEELSDAALRGMVSELDPYSRYYTDAEVAEVERDTRGRYRGIGVVFRPPIEEAQVLFAMPDSPAERAGLDVGDQIVSIDGQPVVGLDADGLRAAIGDPERDRLELVVRGLDGRTRELQVEKDVVLDPSVRHARIADPDAHIGYVAVHSFSESTPEEFDRAVEGLIEQGATSLVVDVRGNFGGLLLAAVELTNRFLPEGLIVSTRGRGDAIEYRADPQRARFAGLPLAILVDGGSASASEVFAAALQDHRAALVVGSPTYGKGTVQRVHPVTGADAIVKLTTAYYFTPSGRNLERTSEGGHGIVPDVVVPVEDETAREIHALLALYGAPEAARPKLLAWEERDGITLLPPRPPDPQLEAAMLALR